ncbi:bifunctional ADP-dependent NAD(P)H-hydrate dehydratase/NAD(P)H-hydrate epimerase [Phormidium tenue]|uniref:Bifunctional NAD(P)H-hydrate repair enzyme n=1 Tax=Phormidium tenue NIES-30 TaxID=549789 RepID=A0A1U7J5C3_9CYAN|nr:bifunctional ADP-dependent NAD(P)H-hydrate dehydratase/NAD(P)H-hydrate epimerase [Phormidium tenue]MBD2232731.1 bifunctional ADP-dependent NAD(P)H-hydrate dehydratase/NAD(P)H-hydrate epimerase [Phormidium tenue FACHB-1052]OKH47843.1 bifunctional ADP-dependent (S)-NAD(P)H-hydrate dehydratase/NAD(P)H-hydrate epimerase [Phormidium tenue NIES-30]
MSCEFRDRIVTAEQMRAIEGRLFEAGMPVAALMEKVAGRIAAWVVGQFPLQRYPRIAVVAGPGHNGGDALVIARELAAQSYQVQVCSPADRLKPLTADHLRFIGYLGIPVVKAVETLDPWDVLIDGLFGFGLERSVEGAMADAVAAINAANRPVVSIDLPSGLHTDTGEALGIAVQATHTLCLGMWKRAFCQEESLAYLGQPHLIGFDIPPQAIEAGLENVPSVWRATLATIREKLPLPRQPNTHKYRVGHLLLVAGSRPYAGAALLAALGARASGVGMLTLAVPESLRLMVVAQIPEALVVGCPETTEGAIAHLPDTLDLSRYSAIACGPGLSRHAGKVVKAVLQSQTPLLLDADGLNGLADLGTIETLKQRQSPTVLTPHRGEFKRLFPEQLENSGDGGAAVQQAAAQSGAVVLLKGACTAIAHPNGTLWYIPESTPALARGGSGDVLTGLIGGLLAQAMASDADDSFNSALDAALVGAWWHGQGARAAARDRTELGVDGTQLAQYLNPVLAQVLA